MGRKAEILAHYRKIGALNFGHVLGHVHRAMSEREGLLQGDPDTWTDSDLTTDAQLAMELYNITIDACGWNVEDFNYVYNRTPEAG